MALEGVRMSIEGLEWPWKVVMAVEGCGELLERVASGVLEAGCAGEALVLECWSGQPSVCSGQ